MDNLKEENKPRSPCCGSEILFIETLHSMHYGKQVCAKCNNWLKWVKKPTAIEKKRKITSKKIISNVVTYHNFKETFCFICLRKQTEIGLNETFEIDHILELRDGGTDDIENLQVLCSACHRLKNWARLYLNKHISERRGINYEIFNN